MDQPTFADLEFENKKRKTRRELFLERMDGLIPWQRLEERIRPYYPKAGRGRRPYDLAVMLRVHCVQVFYNLSDPGMEDLLYEAESVRRYVGVQKRPENLELAVDWQVAMRPGQRRKLEPGTLAAWGERVKASIRAKVEHPFQDVKGGFGYAKSLPPSPIGGPLPGFGQEHGPVGLAAGPVQPEESPTLAGSRLTQRVNGPRTRPEPEKGVGKRQKTTSQNVQSMESTLIGSPTDSKSQWGPRCSELL